MTGKEITTNVSSQLQTSLISLRSHVIPSSILLFSTLMSFISNQSVQFLAKSTLTLKYDMNLPRCEAKQISE